MSINHLLEQKTRPARVDTMDADRINAIVERKSGVNPSKLAAQVTGEPVQEQRESAYDGSIPRGAGPAFDLMQARGGGEEQRLAERVRVLEQRLAQYEDGEARDGSPMGWPRSAEQSTYAPRINNPKAKKQSRKIARRQGTEPDQADGKPDPMPKIGAGQNVNAEGRMSANEMNMLGLEMTEWRRLAGLESPYVNLVETRPAAGYLAESQEAYDDEYDDDSVEASEMEDEYVEAVVEELWDEFLETRGLSTEMFARLIDEAIASEDPEEMDALLAVEDIFLQEVDLKARLRGGGKELTPDQLAKTYGVPRKFGRVVGGSAPSEHPSEKLKRTKAALAAISGPKGEDVEEGYDVDEEGNMSFECDADEDGSPAIPWDKVRRHVARGRR